MKTNYKNNLEIEGNLITDPRHRINKKKEVFILKIAVCFYPCENEKEVYYFDVEVWEESLFELCSQLVKGNRIEVTGRLKEIRWQDLRSNKSKVVIVASSIKRN